MSTGFPPAMSVCHAWNVVSIEISCPISGVCNVLKRFSNQKRGSPFAERKNRGLADETSTFPPEGTGGFVIVRFRTLAADPSHKHAVGLEGSRTKPPGSRPLSGR